MSCCYSSTSRLWSILTPTAQCISLKLGEYVRTAAFPAGSPNRSSLGSRAMRTDRRVELQAKVLIPYDEPRLDPGGLGDISQGQNARFRQHFLGPGNGSRGVLRSPDSAGPHSSHGLHGCRPFATREATGSSSRGTQGHSQLPRLPSGTRGRDHRPPASSGQRRASSPQSRSPSPEGEQLPPPWPGPPPCSQLPGTPAPRALRGRAPSARGPWRRPAPAQGAAGPRGPSPSAPRPPGRSGRGGRAQLTSSAESDAGNGGKKARAARSPGRGRPARGRLDAGGPQAERPGLRPRPAEQAERGADPRAPDGVLVNWVFAPSGAQGAELRLASGGCADGARRGPKRFWGEAAAGAIRLPAGLRARAGPSELRTARARRRG